MKKNFKDKAIAFTVNFIKKHRMLKPLAIALLSIVLFVYKCFTGVLSNGKRLVAVSFVVVFFFMSSSFSNPPVEVEEDVYLNVSVTETVKDSSNAVSDINEVVEVIEVTTIPLGSDYEVSDDYDEDVISTEALAAELDISDTDEDAEAFSVEDFLADYELSSYTEDTASFDVNAWYLILVNKTNPVPDNYDAHLTTLKGSMKCDERVKDVLLKMMAAAKEDGISLSVVSPYRDYKLQEKLFNRKVNEYMNKGYSYLEAYKYASRKVIIPGASEHQLGLAFDILSSGYGVLNSAFGNTEAGKWLREHCYEYGFILRYPKGKEDITGIVYEPWHFRYVGVEAATYITENGLTLEEFIDDL